jgi:hypothetical protein
MLIDTVPMGTKSGRRRKMRGRKLSHSAVSEAKVERARRIVGNPDLGEAVGVRGEGHAAHDAKLVALEEAGGLARRRHGAISGRRHVGAVASTWLQVVAANWAQMAMACASTLPCCERRMAQCWLLRLARTSSVSTTKSPASIGARKFSVNDSGVPRRSGWSSMARIIAAAVTPP